MTVQLDGNNRPVAFGSGDIEGKDIPDPPTTNPPHEYRWDGSAWIHDPPSGPDVSSMTDSEIATALRDGSISAAECLAQMVEDGRV